MSNKEHKEDLKLAIIAWSLFLIFFISGAFVGFNNSSEETRLNDYIYINEMHVVDLYRDYDADGESFFTVEYELNGDTCTGEYPFWRDIEVGDTLRGWVDTDYHTVKLERDFTDDMIFGFVCSALSIACFIGLVCTIRYMCKKRINLEKEDVYEEDCQSK